MGRGRGSSSGPAAPEVGVGEIDTGVNHGNLDAGAAIALGPGVGDADEVLPPPAFRRDGEGDLAVTGLKGGACLSASCREEGSTGFVRRGMSGSGGTGAGRGRLSHTASTPGRVASLARSLPRTVPRTMFIPAMVTGRGWRTSCRRSAFPVTITSTSTSVSGAVAAIPRRAGLSRWAARRNRHRRGPVPREQGRKGGRRIVVTARCVRLIANSSGGNATPPGTGRPTCGACGGENPREAAGREPLPHAPRGPATSDHGWNIRGKAWNTTAGVVNTGFRAGYGREQRGSRGEQGGAEGAAAGSAPGATAGRGESGW